ncbi:MAG TPA: hypothetical protein VKV19_03990 [Ktedonobacteraceae bacterium]|jgi:hypothetical protein|nr:hypothetical protein [Ktedonobacteraceae bacterium]
MYRRVRPRSTLAENLRLARQILPWRLFLLIPFLLAFAIPAFLFGTSMGHRLLPNLTHVFYVMANPTPQISPTPMPPMIQLLPQPGAITYTVQEADSCDEILATHMRMSDAGEIFSQAAPNTVTALDQVMGQNCNDLQPGDTVTLMPQYPLVALGGLVLKVSALSPAAPIPTPLIPVQQQKQPGVDCTNGCLLTVRITSGVEVKLSVTTAIPVPVGAWVWAQAMYPRKKIAGFATYPYPDPTASLNGATLPVCDFQVNDTHDDNSLSCDQLTPNTIDDDGGSWLYAVTGPGGLDHWNYHLHLPEGTQVLLWLTENSNGNLVYHPGNPLYRYDQAQRLYVPA